MQHHTREATQCTPATQGRPHSVPHNNKAHPKHFSHVTCAVPMQHPAATRMPQPALIATASTTASTGPRFRPGSRSSCVACPGLAHDHLELGEGPIGCSLPLDRLISLRWKEARGGHGREPRGAQGRGGGRAHGRDAGAVRACMRAPQT